MNWKIRYIDYYVLVPYLVLCLISAIMVFSASGLRGYGSATNTTILIKQLIFIVAGFAVCAVVYFSKLKVWKSPGLLAIGIVIDMAMLIYLLFFGRSVNGASAWISVGGFNIQPSEIAKLLIILYLARILDRRQRVIGRYKFPTAIKMLGWPLGLLVFIALLVLAQPDTGGFFILGVIMLVMVVASGFHIGWGLGFIGGGIGFIGALYYFVVTHFAGFLSKSYQGQRLLAVLQPFEMQKTAGRQLVISMYAINHGGLFGVGLGNSQMKLGYLPEPYTDFILSVISEELGMVGGMTVICLLVFLVCRIIQIGARSHSAYRTMLMYGIATMIFVQMFVNVGAVLGLLPITGVTLPFISYGGSSMLVLAASIGIVLNVSAAETRDRMRLLEAKESNN
ncbi:FtsW/RodA/SpoVE family cell cycle protein [Lacticaseibacillus sharpeae]|uniref:Probable peptidoglycan glycosyltransferase FtsW n=1 Tax=Lacticaseibacillus sharpeae JCM 1186 = DSM 20505 TaxID=1291052 RepID=A0A0R1ZLN1_9LACO|nr:FtsW/RodA/SpoVE family cell cycle protein [Lacticaseibacillus sharpeae]KRM55944.1 cell division membrane protein [Lacticaseibacillus sharpeae JCM 1186 = DSM 20505]